MSQQSLRRPLFRAIAALLLTAISSGCAHSGATTDTPSALEAAHTASPLVGVWRDLETSSAFTVAEERGKLVVVSVVASDTEVYPVTSQGVEGGQLKFTYHVPSTGYDVTIVALRVEGSVLKATWANAEASGDQDFERVQ